MLVCNSYMFHTHTPKALLSYGVFLNWLSSEFSDDEVKNYVETKVGFKVELVGLVNISEDKWILRNLLQVVLL